MTGQTTLPTGRRRSLPPTGFALMRSMKRFGIWGADFVGAISRTVLEAKVLSLRGRMFLRQALIVGPRITRTLVLSAPLISGVAIAARRMGSTRAADCLLSRESPIRAESKAPGHRTRRLLFLTKGFNLLG